MATDRKVVRWCMNVLARLGTKASAGCAETILKRYEDDPEIVAAAVSAISHFRLGQITELPTLRGVPPEVQMLASMQTVDPSRLAINGLKLDIYCASPEVLKLALIVVGLDRDVQNLLHPRHDNGDIVKELAQHDDPIVRQYSVWAVLENSRLSIEHLGIDLDRLEEEPANVQSKLLQLGASSLSDLVRRQDLIIRGTDLPSVDAREGLAKGLSNNYYDGLEGVALNWFDTDGSDRVQLVLAEHFARYADRVPSYREKALDLLNLGSDFRDRVLLGSEGTSLFAEIKRNETVTTPNLFDVGQDDPRSQLVEAVKMSENQTVLVLNATPDDQGCLRADKEGALLERQLEMVKHRERELTVVHRHAVRLSDIQKELLNNRPKILHFSGHGGPGILVFEKDDGTSEMLGAENLAEILRIYGKLDCLVLHACFSEDVARACAKHVPVVIGSTDAIDDYTAPKFTYAFYQGLANGRDYKNSFEMGKAEVALASPEQAKLYVIYER